MSPDGVLPPPPTAADFPALRAMAAQASDAQGMADLDACLDGAGEHGGGCDRAPLTGFGWAGRIAWPHTAHSPRIKAAVAWYGRLEGEAPAHQPRFPIDRVGDLKAPVLGPYGEVDQSIPLDSVERMRHALERAAVSTDIVVYSTAQNGFHSDNRTSYQRAAAEHGWAAMTGWFSTYGVRP